MPVVRNDKHLTLLKKRPSENWIAFISSPLNIDGPDSHLSATLLTSTKSSFGSSTLGTHKAFLGSPGIRYPSTHLSILQWSVIHRTLSTTINPYRSNNYHYKLYYYLKHSCRQAMPTHPCVFRTWNKSYS